MKRACWLNVIFWWLQHGDGDVEDGEDHRISVDLVGNSRRRFSGVCLFFRSVDGYSVKTVMLKMMKITGDRLDSGDDVQWWWWWWWRSPEIVWRSGDLVWPYRSVDDYVWRRDRYFISKMTNIPLSKKSAPCCWSNHSFDLTVNNNFLDFVKFCDFLSDPLSCKQNQTKQKQLIHTYSMNKS